MRGKNDCVCCPNLRIIPCGDTDEHKHPGCGIVGVIANKIVKEVCLEDFQTCGYLTGEAVAQVERTNLTEGLQEEKGGKKMEETEDKGFNRYYEMASDLASHIAEWMTDQPNIESSAEMGLVIGMAHNMIAFDLGMDRQAEKAEEEEVKRLLEE